MPAGPVPYVRMKSGGDDESLRDAIASLNAATPRTCQCDSQTDLMLRTVARRRILDEMIGTVARASKDGQASPCAVIVDGQSLCVLSACCKAYDIIEKGATVVEGLMKRRQPLPDVDAIYFVSATAESVEAITKDFHGDKAQHKKVHIFLSGPLNNESGILEILTKSSSLLPRLRSLVEFNLNFIAYESRIFHLNRPDSLAEVYEGEEGSNMATLGAIADQLLTLCATFKDIPNIRFQTGASRFTEQIASLLHAKLKRLDWLGTRGRTTLVIIDRSIDCAPLFLHEYTYQAVAYDLLGISCASTLEEVEAQQGDDAHADDTYQYEFTSNQGKLERKVALLNESDEVWLRYRHRHITAVNKGVTDEIRKFAKDNAAAQLNRKKVLSSEETVKAIRALPQYQEMLAKFWAHVTMSEECFRELQRHGIMKIGALEQDITTGVDKDGAEVPSSKLLATMGNLLSDQGIAVEEKLRLLMLYFVSMDNVKDDDRRKMVEAAQLSLDASKAARRFLTMGLMEMSEAPTSDKGGAKHVNKITRERFKFFQRRARTTDYELSRFEPRVKEIMEQACQDSLHLGKFPFVAEPERQRGGRQDISGKGGNIRARDGVEWSFGEVHSAKGKQQPEEEQPGKSKRTLIFFVIGGISMSEMRCAYEVARQQEVDVYLGGSTILTPRQVIQQLKRKPNHNNY